MLINNSFERHILNEKLKAMENYRIYGRGQIEAAVIHGGPGAAGSVASVAKRLSIKRAVIEPLQTKNTIKAQVEELKDVLVANCSGPINLIGHSWGAWLACIFAERYPFMVKKIILVASAPFEERYALDISEKRISRLTEKQRIRLDFLSGMLKQHGLKNKSIYLGALSLVFLKTDSYDLIPGPYDKVNIKYNIYKDVWPEAEKLRKSGGLIDIIKRIDRPVTAIHGDYDPHAYLGVKEPLKKHIKNFSFILLKDCGHYPWLEKNSKDKFFKILNKEITYDK